MSELDPRVAALLQAAKTIEPVDAETAARVWAGLGAGAAVTTAVASGSSAASSAVSTAATTGATTAATVAGTHVVAAKVWLTVGLVAGVGIGSAGGYWARGRVETPVTPQVKVVPVAPVVEPEVVSPPVVAPNPEPEPARVPAPVVPTVKPAPTPGPASDAALGRERATIDRARSALQRNMPDEALKTLNAAALEFAHGLLAEERMALTVHALQASGRTTQARALKAQFVKQYPQSLLRPAVEADVEAVPSGD